MEKVLASIKILSNIVSLHNKVVYENQLHIRPPAEHVNNILNPNMNNLMAIDYVNKDLTHDTDYILSRWT